MENTLKEEVNKEEISFDTQLKIDKKFLRKIGEIILSQDKKFFKRLEANLQGAKTQNAKSLEGYYTVKEVSEILNIGANTIRKMITDGRLEATRPSKSYIITQEALEKFINPNKNE